MYTGASPKSKETLRDYAALLREADDFTNPEARALIDNGVLNWMAVGSQSKAWAKDGAWIQKFVTFAKRMCSKDGRRCKFIRCLASNIITPTNPHYSCNLTATHVL